MNIGAIKQAIGEHLQGIPFLPQLVLPNKTAIVPVPPYIIVEFVPTGRTDPTLAGGSITDTGYAMITVVSQSNAFETEADEQAQIIADRFPMGLRMAVGTEKVLIVKPSEVKQGYPGGVHWRTPVKIFYRTE